MELSFTILTGATRISLEEESLHDPLEKCINLSSQNQTTSWDKDSSQRDLGNTTEDS